MKSIPISVRVSQDEAESLARLHIPGATTPSEKLRALITDAHNREQGPQDYPEAIVQSQQWLAPVFEAIQTTESRLGQQSDIIALLREWLPDLTAQLRLNALGQTNNRESLSKSDLLAMEKDITERLVRLMERVFQLSLTSRCHCYDPELLSKRMDLIRHLAAIITQQSFNQEEP